MFNGRVRLNLPNKTSINEDVTTYTLYPLGINSLPIIVDNLGSSFTPLTQKEDKPGPYIDENGVVTISYNNFFRLSVEAYNEVDIQNGVVVSGSGAQNLVYTWRKNGIVLTTTNHITIQGNKLIINSLIGSDSGTYTVDVQNDVGFVTSDAVTLEVIQLTEVEGFYTNLVQNYDASQNVNAWTEISAQGNQVITKKFLNNLQNTGVGDKSSDSTNYIYPDHFNKSEINDGTLKLNSETSVNTPLISRGDNTAVLGSLKYFTRRPYLSYLDQGSNRVQFYQDVDLSDYVRYIDGTVGGVEGVEANFQCFVGNCISYFIPKKNLQTTSGRIQTDQYCFEQGLPKPRLLVENKEYVEVIAEDCTTVYIEEYQGANLIKVHNPINDPYRSTYEKDTITPSNGAQPYETGFLTYKNSDQSTNIGNNLPEFFEDLGVQPSNMGQYVSLRKLQIEKLNRKTNKLRIRIEFFHKGLQQIQGDSPVDVIKKYRTDGILLIPTFLQDKTSAKNYMVDTYTFGKKVIKQNNVFSDIIPAYGQPRNFITGFVCYIQPKETATSIQNIENVIREQVRR